LHQTIETLAFLGDLMDVRDFSPESEAVLMAAVLGEAEFLGIVCFDDKGPGVSFWLGGWGQNEKALANEGQGKGRDGDQFLTN
jgi:hypothetical protein